MTYYIKFALVFPGDCGCRQIWPAAFTSVGKQLFNFQVLEDALPDTAYKMLISRDHVCQHRAGVWNSVFSDQFREQIYIRCGNAKGEFVGLTPNPDQVAGYLLSYHICNSLPDDG